MKGWELCPVKHLGRLSPRLAAVSGGSRRETACSQGWTPASPGLTWCLGMFAAFQEFGSRAPGCQSDPQIIPHCCSSLWEPILVQKTWTVASMTLHLRRKPRAPWFFQWEGRTWWKMDGPYGSTNFCTDSVDSRNNLLQAWDLLWDKNINHMASCSKYQGVNGLCQQAGQPGEESFKLKKQDQAGEMVMTPTPLKRLWTGLIRGHRVKAGRRDLESRIEGGWRAHWF